jgi:hypothetical protein
VSVFCKGLFIRFSRFRKAVRSCFICLIYSNLHKEPKHMAKSSTADEARERRELQSKEHDQAVSRCVLRSIHGSMWVCRSAWVAKQAVENFTQTGRRKEKTGTPVFEPRLMCVACSISVPPLRLSYLRTRHYPPYLNNDCTSISNLVSHNDCRKEKYFAICRGRGCRAPRTYN